MFGGARIPVEVKGSKSEVKAFARALGREKRYMDSIKKFCLYNPKTYKDKLKLNKAIKDFTRKTKLKWPFK